MNDSSTISISDLQTLYDTVFMSKEACCWAKAAGWWLIKAKGPIQAAIPIHGIHPLLVLFINAV